MLSDKDDHSSNNKEYSVSMRLQFNLIANLQGVYTCSECAYELFPSGMKFNYQLTTYIGIIYS
jgi:hypothetical protein